MKVKVKCKVGTVLTRLENLKKEFSMEGRLGAEMRSTAQNIANNIVERLTVTNADTARSDWRADITYEGWENSRPTYEAYRSEGDSSGRVSDLASLIKPGPMEIRYDKKGRKYYFIGIGKITDLESIPASTSTNSGQWVRYADTHALWALLEYGTGVYSTFPNAKRSPIVRDAHWQVFPSRRTNKRYAISTSSTTNPGQVGRHYFLQVTGAWYENDQMAARRLTAAIGAMFANANKRARK